MGDGDWLRHANLCALQRWNGDLLAGRPLKRQIRFRAPLFVPNGRPTQGSTLGRIARSRRALLPRRCNGLADQRLNCEWAARIQDDRSLWSYSRSCPIDPDRAAGATRYSVSYAACIQSYGCTRLEAPLL